MEFNGTKEIPTPAELDKFILASDKEKELLIRRTDHVGYFKDGIKRLIKNKIAFAALITVLLLTALAFLLPPFLPRKLLPVLRVRQFGGF